MTEDSPPRLAILGGTGREGSGLAVRWAHAGYAVTLGSRFAERAAAAGDCGGLVCGDDKAACEAAIGLAKAAGIRITGVPDAPAG